MEIIYTQEEAFEKYNNSNDEEEKSLLWNKYELYTYITYIKGKLYGKGGERYP